jgi:hypothetical protein
MTNNSRIAIFRQLNSSATLAFNKRSGELTGLITVGGRTAKHEKQLPDTNKHQRARQYQQKSLPFAPAIVDTDRQDHTPNQNGDHDVAQSPAWIQFRIRHSSDLILIGNGITPTTESALRGMRDVRSR